MPILECLLLTADTNSFKLTANDMELAIESANIESEIEETGSIALDARFFSDIIRKINGDIVYITADENNSVTIKCGRSEFKMPGQNGEDFPPIQMCIRDSCYTVQTYSEYYCF